MFISKVIFFLSFLAGYDAPSPRRVFHSAAGPGRAYLLSAEQPAEVFRAHAQVRKPGFGMSGRVA